MRLERRKPSGREKDEEALKLLEQLRERLYCSNSSAARKAAFNLSWMQEDGLEILQEAVFGNTPRRSKSAAAYGLRNMHGRMKKLSRTLLEEGAKSNDRHIREVCRKSLDILDGNFVPKPPRREGRSRFQIRDVRARRRPSQMQPGRGNSSFPSRERNFNR